MAKYLPERVACAAVKLITGTKIAGERHHDCLAAIHREGLNRVGATQGFMTTRGRFLDRRQARQMQENLGIQSVAPEGYRGDILFSEDLYLLDATDQSSTTEGSEATLDS